MVGLFEVSVLSQARSASAPPALQLLGWQRRSAACGGAPAQGPLPLSLALPGETAGGKGAVSGVSAGRWRLAGRELRGTGQPARSLSARY